MERADRESPVRAAAVALARGEGLRALSLIGAVDAPPALVLRGIAYAQMGDLELARELLDRARRATTDVLDDVARARIAAALAEIAVAEGDAARGRREARAAAEALGHLGDARNAAMQHLVVARAEVLLGRLGSARRAVDALLAEPLAPVDRAVALLAAAEIAVRQVAPSRARETISEARAALRDAPNALLGRALDALEADLARPVARLVVRGVEAPANLFAIEASSRGDVLLVDACRRLVVAGRATVRLARRPVLFALVRVLARAWPGDVARDDLAAAAFDVRRPNESHRARLRVEIGRLRKELAGIAAPTATARGYVLESARSVRLLVSPGDDAGAGIALLLADGAAWTAQAIAEHAGISKRTAQRALAVMVEAGRAHRVTRGKDVRYTATEGEGSPIASRLLLLGLVPTS